MRSLLSWVHFGDLHIRSAEDENYEDFLELIEDVNRYLAGNIDFAYLPGDNADDGTAEQYRLVRDALAKLRVPVHIIVGDHDRKSGSLADFKHYLEPQVYRSRDLAGFRLLFLNAIDGPAPDIFDVSTEQISWLRRELADSVLNGLRPLVFTHLYPSELQTAGPELKALLHGNRVELVEMGHTHYNELANDGRIIYAATRSTGQIEEGPPGLSITTIDADVISWKFQERRTWPFVQITSPADYRLITRPESVNHVVRGTCEVRAKVWPENASAEVLCSLDDGPHLAMQFLGGLWRCFITSSEFSDGIHRLNVIAHFPGLGRGTDTISILINQNGHYAGPQRAPVDYDNTIGSYPDKGIFGTELGPNEKGTKGPWPSWRT